MIFSQYTVKTELIDTYWNVNLNVFHGALDSFMN